MLFNPLFRSGKLSRFLGIIQLFKKKKEKITKIIKNRFTIFIYPTIVFDRNQLRARGVGGVLRVQFCRYKVSCYTDGFLSANEY